MTEAGPTRRARNATVRGALGGVLTAAALLAGCRGERGGAVGSDSTVVPDTGATVTADPAPAMPVPAVAVVDSALPAPPAVSAYIRYVQDYRGAPDSVRAARDLAAEGLRLLASGLDALAERDTVVAEGMRPRVALLRARADSVQSEVEPLQRARLASESFVLASELLQALQEANARPALTDRAAEARQAAAGVRADQPLSTQTEAVRRFLERAAAALRGLVGARAG